MQLYNSANLRALICIVLAIWCARSASGQINTYPYVADTQIKSVQVNGASTAPIVDIKKGQVHLSFDHMGYDIMDYVYTIVHCDAEWRPSDIEYEEYLDGYQEDRLLDSDPTEQGRYSSISNSLNTLVPFTHYELTLPNRNMKWRISGNYILQIMDDDDDKRVVMTLRFMVSEEAWRVFPTLPLVSNSGKSFTHHEVDFQVNHDRFNISNPQRDVKCYVLQNMRWDRIIGPITPRPVVTMRNSMDFDYQDSIVFPAGKEFRFFDIRNLDFRTLAVQSIERGPKTYQVYLKPQYDLNSNHSYALTADINGAFNIENNTPGQSEDLRRAEYANVILRLERQLPYETEEVYVVGGLTNWALLPEYKMEYDAASKAYVLNMLLKQGFYNYEIQVVDNTTFRPDPDGGVEGNWHETENLYTILAYYRPFGSRFDRLMARGGIDTRRR
jgi:Domain of unknown function (DUF5103)